MKQIGKLIREVIPVIIGILIALFINNWNDDRKERQYLEEILTSVEFELEETRQEIDTITILQYSLIDTLKFYLEDEGTSIQSIMEKTNGISIPTIRIHSWKALSNSRIELVDYKDLSSLANIEDGKALLKEKSKYVMTFLYDNIGEKSRHKKAVFAGLINDLISTEQSILLEINEINKRLGARK